MGCSHSTFLPLSQGQQPSQAVFGWSQIMSLVSALYGNVPLTLQVFPQSCEKLSDIIKHSDISGTSELPIIYTL